MGLEEIIWRNRLYAAQPKEQPFAEIRIRQHFTRRRLSRRGIVKAVVQYESCIYRCLVALTSFCRPTGWHGPDSHIVNDIIKILLPIMFTGRTMDILALLKSTYKNASVFLGSLVLNDR